MVKRLFDVVVAAVLLLLLAPILLAIAVSIRVTSRGPVIFRQERVGRGGRTFAIYKFRSMVANAASIGSPLTIGEDPRITRVGRFLRRTKLDELPQLANVIAGDMSLVGPRPEIAKFVALYPRGARERVLSVRPGVTDEAAIELIDEAQLLASSTDPEWAYVHEILPRKLEVYERYVATHTLWLDLKILGRTLARLVGRRGSNRRHVSSAPSVVAL